MRLEGLGNVVVSSVASQHKAGSPLLSMCMQVYFRYSGCLPESEYMKRWFEQVIQMLKCYCGGYYAQVNTTALLYCPVKNEG